MIQEFFRPRLVGFRFNEHSLPLEFLKDFTVLEEMIVEVAKWKYREKWGRVRVPKGFTDGLELHLARVEGGSSIPVIAFILNTLLAPSHVAYFEQARDAIVEAVASADQDGVPTDSLPPNLMAYFDRFGRSLRKGERMELDTPTCKTASLTVETRRKLIQASQVVEWTQEEFVRGAVCEVDQARMAFEIEMKDGARLKAPLGDQHLESILDAFQDYRSGTLILLQGVVRRDRQDRLKSIESVEHVTVLDPRDVDARLEVLSLLQDGWLDGKGRAPAPSDLSWLSTSFDTSFEPDLPLPCLYPTPEGGIQAEWTLAPWEISLEINLPAKTADLQALDTTSSECHEVTLDLSTPDAWRELCDTLRRLNKGAA